MKNTTEHRPTPPSRGWRCVGGIMLVHYAAIAAVQVSHGQTDDLLWMSYVALLVAGIGLASGVDLLPDAALVGIATLHTLWIFDFACFWLFDWSPFGATAYLAEAVVWQWMATSVHFYLLPVLTYRFHQIRRIDPRALPLAWGLFVVVAAAGRIVASPSSNINNAYGILPEAQSEWINRFNALPGSVYLPILNVMVILLALFPAFWLFRFLEAQEITAKHAKI